MFIRRTSIKSRKNAKPYYTYRLVENQRIGDKVKQHTLINLGRYFDVPQAQWQLLSARIKHCLEGQSDFLGTELPEELEQLAQRYVAQIIATQGEDPLTGDQDYQCVDLSTMELLRPRRIGVEQLACHALDQLALPKALASLGFNQRQTAAALGNIVARMAFPASERASHRWLQQRSGLRRAIGFFL